MKENCSERVHILQMDVTSDEQVQECVQYVTKYAPKTGIYIVATEKKC